MLRVGRLSAERRYTSVLQDSSEKVCTPDVPPDTSADFGTSIVKFKARISFIFVVCRSEMACTDKFAKILDRSPQ